MTLNLHGTKVRVLLHSTAWAILLGLPFYNFYRFDVPKEFVLGFYVNALINGIIFYANYLLLIPKFFLKDKRLKYYLSALLIAFCLFFASVLVNRMAFERGDRINPHEQDHTQQVENRIRPEGPPHSDRRLFRIPFGAMHLYNFTFNAIVFTVFAMGLKILERHAEIEKRRKELEKEKLNSELAFLKNQISPHFFFNTLNNIYSLIGINTTDSQEAVLKLSKMMRYLLYESEQGETNLNAEIEFMNNYIDLMRLRLSDKVKLTVSFPVKYDEIKIPPLLFISIIENAFKHGISYREKSFIDIAMEVSKEMITFNCANSMVNKGEKKPPEASGIGLENLRKRLGLLFPGCHELKIEQSESAFLVFVHIFLNKC